MFTWDDPTIPTDAQVAFAKRIHDVTGRTLPDDMTKQALHRYISAGVDEYRWRRIGERLYPDDLDWSASTDASWNDWDEMELWGLDPYTGGFAED